MFFYISPAKYPFWVRKSSIMRPTRHYSQENKLKTTESILYKTSREFINYMEIKNIHTANFLPFVTHHFPQGATNDFYKQQLVQSYRQIPFLEDVIVGLIDHTRHQAFYLSDNFERITGIKPRDFFGWKSMFLFRLMSPTHYSYAYRTIQEGAKFFDATPLEKRTQIRRFAAGMKFYNGDRKIRRIFSKSQSIILGKQGQLNISAFYIYDVSHLIKGSNYWIRHAAPDQTSCFVKQKGKQHFDDLLSPRETEIVRLLADHRTSNEIADQLFLAAGTVEKHRKNMLKRTGAVTSTALVHLCKMAEIV